MSRSLIPSILLFCIIILVIVSLQLVGWGFATFTDKHECILTPDNSTISTIYYGLHYTPPATKTATPSPQSSNQPRPLK